MIPRRHVVSTSEAAPYFDALAAEAELDIPPFSEKVVEEVDRVVHASLTLPPGAVGSWRDETQAPFVTLDPKGSKDLDQAMCIERTSKGYRVRYAIADLGPFVAPGGVLDAVTRARGTTMYLPDRRIPLHPERLSEGAASLLPNQVRPALVWDATLATDGSVISIEVARCLIKSRQAYSYPEVQQAIDAGSAPEIFLLLKEVGLARIALEQARGAIHLALPDQELVRSASGWELEYRTPLPVEDWNAQLSLLVGMEAGRMLVEAGVGMLRVMPPPEVETVNWLRGIARSLGIAWPAGDSFQSVVRAQDGSTPNSAAFVTQAARLLRGAGYEVITEKGGGNVQSAVAAHYAHVTAPLRRLGDRFNNEALLAIAGGYEVPHWVQDALPELPASLMDADRRANALERKVVDLIEALLLQPLIGSQLHGRVIRAEHSAPTVEVQIEEPAVMARIAAEGVALGDEITLRVDGADPQSRTSKLTILSNP